MDRLIPRTGIAALATRLRRQRKRIVFTNGVFDILHRGHVEYLTKARSFGDVLMVGLNTDASVRRLKGPSRPVQPERDRAAVLLGLRAVDFVILFGEDTPDKLIRQVRPDVMVKGADYRESEIVGADFVKSYGGYVRRVRLTPGRSTTSVLTRLAKGKKSTSSCRQPVELTAAHQPSHGGAIGRHGQPRALPMANMLKWCNCAAND